MILSCEQSVRALLNIEKSYSPKEIMELSLEAVLEGSELPYILEMASLHDPDDYDIQEIWKHYKKEFYLPKDIAAKMLVCDVCQRIVDHSIEPPNGAAVLGIRFYSDFGNPPELNIMRGLVSEWDDGKTQETKDYIAQLIINTAKEMLEPSFEINSLKER